MHFFLAALLALCEEHEFATGVNHQLWNQSATPSVVIQLKAPTPSEPETETVAVCLDGGPVMRVLWPTATASAAGAQRAEYEDVMCAFDEAAMQVWATLGDMEGFTLGDAWPTHGLEPSVTSKVRDEPRFLGSIAAACDIATTEKRWVCHRPHFAHLYEAVAAADNSKFHLACRELEQGCDPICHALRALDRVWLRRPALSPEESPRHFRKSLGEWELP